MADEIKVITHCRKCNRVVYTIHVDAAGMCCSCEAGSDFRDFDSGSADNRGSEEVTPTPPRRKRKPVGGKP